MGDILRRRLSNGILTIKSKMGIKQRIILSTKYKRGSLSPTFITGKNSLTIWIVCQIRHGSLCHVSVDVGKTRRAKSGSSYDERVSPPNIPYGWETPRMSWLTGWMKINYRKSLYHWRSLDDGHISRYWWILG